MRAIEYFDKQAEATPDRTAIIDGSVKYSYAGVQAASQRIARAMWAAGLRGEEPAAIYSINDARVLLCMLGLMRAGAVWVPINYRNALDAIVDYLNYVKTSWLFYHSSYRDRIPELQARVPTLQQLICIDAQDGKNPSLEKFMQAGADAKGGDSTSRDVDWADALGNTDRLVGLVPTGGTTGSAKGVRVTSLSWGTMTEMASHYWRSEGCDPVCLSVAPLSHAAGVVAFTMFTLGATNLVMPGFDALEVLRHIERFRVTHLFLPPTAFYGLLAHPDVHKFDYSSLRVFLLAASPVSPDKLKQGVEIFGPCLCQSYGQTEAPMLMTFLDQKTIAAAAAGDRPERLRSCGQPTSSVRLAIMDEQGQLLPPGQPGEIVARGSLVSPGYYEMPEATAEIRTHGWHHTGDIGYRDEDGFFYIVDRKKDMIISGGFNVYSAEVEAALMALPQIQECAVIGVPHPKWGEAVKALVVLRASQSLTEQEILEHCKTKLGGVKCPKSIEFVAEIAKTPAGKIDRKQLRKAYWANTDRAVH
ncbi:MAG TPA: AMP-binding protein [Candidatus Acidoferrales bacterium]|jgi:acyl-CoA synthetase (AMP-forming)/AMP-acid ligase II|nr:AMP-binding protein [Candidatus Acidoferrales bacterium]